MGVNCSGVLQFVPLYSIYPAILSIFHSILIINKYTRLLGHTAAEVLLDLDDVDHLHVLGPRLGPDLSNTELFDLKK